ncbi:MAG: hypothetical protein GKR95_00955 [Gammaproteobacteria bacterium]|nr:hypothetical protein [Gammaproteobacteria bacterium]
MSLYLRLVVLVFALVLSGCATRSLDPYSEFAEAGQQYAKSLNDVFDVAQATAIDRSSAELIDENSFADRQGNGFSQQELERLEKIRMIDVRRIQAFSVMRQHVSTLSKYFTQLSELVGTKEVSQTSNALAATAKSINALSQKLGTAGVFELSEANQKKIASFSEYVIGSRQRATLKKRIQRDQPIIQMALNTHEELLGVIADDLNYDIEVLSDRQNQLLIEGPFLASTPLMKSPEKAVKWMEDRRRLLTAESSVLALAEASKAAAGSLGELLKEVVKNERNLLKQIELFKAELDAIQAVIKAFE